MLVRSLTLAALLCAASPSFAADSSAPLAQELGKTRPLVVIAPSSADPTLRGLTKAMQDPATAGGFTQRNLVLFSVAGMIGKRDDKGLEQQSTMALIRELKLGASKGTRVILVGKDGQQHLLQDSDGNGPLDAQAVFKAVDELPASEKAVTAPEPVAAAPAKPAGKDSKPAKPGKPAAPPKPLED